MLELTIEAPSLDRLRRRFDQAPGIIGEELRRGMTDAVQVAQDAVRGHTPTRTGRTRASIVGQVRLLPGNEIEGSVRPLRQAGRPGQLVEWLEEGTRPHVIRARGARVLAFQMRGRTVFATRVMHPGTRAYRMIARGSQDSLPAIRRIFAARLGNVTRRLGRQ